MFLTLQRCVTYAVATLVLGLIVIFASLWRTPERAYGAVDFPAFYDAGRAINLGRGSDLYDREAQQRLYQDVAPTIDPREAPLYVYPPFLALVFAPLAVLPYSIAFALWIVISVAMFAIGFRLVWTSELLPLKYMREGFLIAFSFMPFYAWCLFMGQTSAFGFFWLALAIYFDRKERHILSGCCLAMMLYKPPLVILFVPMLLVTKRWRTLAGFHVCSALIVLSSLALIGWAGIPAYLDMAARFTRAKTATHLTLLEVDAFSFFVLLTRGHARWALVLLLITVALAAPFLVKAWRAQPSTSWATAITWTLVLNFYLLMYDTTLIILAVLMSLRSLTRLPSGLKVALVGLFVVPWIHTAASHHFSLQPMTLVLTAFGIYQLWVSRLNYHHVIDPKLGSSAAGG